MRHVAIRSMRGCEQQSTAMPLRSYFICVGGALLALLLAVDGLKARAPVGDVASAAVEFPPIRIHSAIKGPEAVVIDTNHAPLPTASADAVAAAETNAVPSLEAADPTARSTAQIKPQQAADPASSASPSEATGREAMAQLVQPPRSISRKRKGVRAAAPARRYAQARSEAFRQPDDAFRNPGCDWCGPFQPRQRF